jgi:hypothetical protein
MKDKILPLDLRNKIMDMMDEGLSNEEIFSKILPEAHEYVSSEKQLVRCINSIRGHHSKGRRPS